jgi:exodeoxyribonuclease-3
VDVLTFNLNNPSRERAERQLAYLADRPEDVLVLTETADSAGCAFLEERFTAAGYAVVFPRPPARGERGVMVVSRLAARPGTTRVSYLPHRCVSVVVDTFDGPLDVVGLYVPSRDASPAKTARKRDFLEACRAGIPRAGGARRLVIGDLNVLEPDHHPRYPFFKEFEYGFYRWFGEAGYADAFRTAHREAAEYSWVGRTGDGYRYDHAFTSAPGEVRGCAYVHEVRTGPDRLTDHSALTVSLAPAPARRLEVSVPAPAEDPALALF